MPILKGALYPAAAVGLYVAYASWRNAIAPDMAMVRGIVGFMAITFIGYLAELLVSTIPPQPTHEDGAVPTAQSGVARLALPADHAASSGAPVGVDSGSAQAPAALPALGAGAEVVPPGGQTA